MHEQLSKKNEIKAISLFQGSFMIINLRTFANQLKSSCIKQQLQQVLPVVTIFFQHSAYIAGKKICAMII